MDILRNPERSGDARFELRLRTQAASIRRGDPADGVIGRERKAGWAPRLLQLENGS